MSQSVFCRTQLFNTISSNTTEETMMETQSCIYLLFSAQKWWSLSLSGYIDISLILRLCWQATRWSCSSFSVVFHLFLIRTHVCFHNNEGPKPRKRTSVVSSLLLKSEHCRTWSTYLLCKSSSCWSKHAKQVKHKRNNKQVHNILYRYS